MVVQVCGGTSVWWYKCVVVKVCGSTSVWWYKCVVVNNVLALHT